MPDDIAGPALPYSDELGLRLVYTRIALIRLHFARCCASRTGQCRYNAEYSELCERLTLAGVPAAAMPLDRAAFEEFMAARRDEHDH